MTKNLISLVIVALLVSFAGAEFRSPKSVQPGQLLVIEAAGLPSNTAMASFSLGGRVHGLLMERGADGKWTGKFAVLPSMAGQTLDPLVTARLASGGAKTFALPPVRVESVSSAPSHDGFLSSDEGHLIFGFGSTIQLDSVKVHTTQGVIERVPYENNYFKLPSDVSLNEVEQIEATSVRGENLEITPAAYLQAAR